SRVATSLRTEQRAAIKYCVNASYIPTQTNDINGATNGDGWKTVPEIAEEADIGHSCTRHILTGMLNISKVSARWVPPLLKEEERT
ncbi:hypothetical protein MAR_037632, partial [Mya arenaria]